MQLPERRPRRQKVDPEPDPLRIAQAAASATYLGSPEHKQQHSWLGQPKLRSDATPCPPDLHDQALLTGWLRTAISQGWVSEQWNDTFPRYVWFAKDGALYEGRLVNLTSGEYKGYPIKDSQKPRGFRWPA